MKIRRANSDDAQAIGAVFDAAVRKAWTYLPLDDEPMFSPDDWNRLVDDHAPPNILLVATAPTGQVIGYVAAHPADGEVFLLFVHPTHGRQGVGRALLDAAHDALRAAGCQEAYLYTHEQNERALAVYHRRAGYVPDGTVREDNFRGTPTREPRLVKRL